MREVGLESNDETLQFAARLIAGEIDLVVFLTGVGVRAMVDIVQTCFNKEEFLEALRRVKIAARGAKPSTALRELKIPVHAISEEPSTWRELIRAMEESFGASLRNMRVAVQEYGASNPEFLEELSTRSADLLKIPVYQWALPEDLQPMRDCVSALVAGEIDVVLFMTAVQVIHLFQVAEQMALVKEITEHFNRSLFFRLDRLPPRSWRTTEFGRTLNRHGRRWVFLSMKRRSIHAGFSMRKETKRLSLSPLLPKSWIRKTTQRKRHLILYDVLPCDANDGRISRWSATDRFFARDQQPYCCGGFAASCSRSDRVFHFKRDSLRLVLHLRARRREPRDARLKESSR